MDNVVVDSSIAIKWFVTEPYSTEAHHILTAYRDGTITFLAPDLLYAEFGNILWKKCRIQGMSNSDANEILNTFAAISMTITSSESLLNDAFLLAMTHQRTVYDSLYMALSAREQCPFITADERFFNAVGSVFPTIVWIANWTPPAPQPSDTSA